MDDTAGNISETFETLLAQREQLLEGRRFAQMFPTGTPELPVPNGFVRTVTDRGAYHHDPRVVTPEEVKMVSSAKRENMLLGLGPYNKEDIVKRDEPHVAIVERTPKGVEVKAALGTKSTADEQIRALNKSKTPGNTVTIEDIYDVLKKRRGV